MSTLTFTDLTRTMGKSFDKVAPRPKLLMPFFANIETQDNEIVELDKQLSGVRVAEFVNPDAVADGREKLSFDNYVFKLPTMQDSTSLTAKELKKRLRGQNVYTQVTNAAKAAILIAELKMEQKDFIENKMELMAIDAAFNGQITVIGKGENRVIDFNRSAANTIDLGAGNYWDEAGGKPEDDLETFIDIIGQDGSNATHVIGRLDTMRILVKKLEENDALSFDGRHVERAMLTFQSFADVNGAIYYGQYKNLELWGYDGNYTDSDDVSQKAIPVKKVVIMSATNGNRDIAGYAPDIDIDYPAIEGNTRAVKDNRNLIMKISKEKKLLDSEIIQTRAPMLVDANSTISATVLA